MRVGVAVLVLSVQMPEGDGEGRAGLLAEPQRVRGKGGVEGLGGGGAGNGGGCSYSQLPSELREERRVVQCHLWPVGGGMIELGDRLVRGDRG